MIRRLCSLVPPPQSHLVRYHGVFAPNSRWSHLALPTTGPPQGAPSSDWSLDDHAFGADGVSDPPWQDDVPVLQTSER